MTHRVPQDVSSFLIDLTEVNQWLMQLDPEERRKITRELKTMLAILLVAQKKSGKQIDINRLAHWLRVGFDPEYANEEVRLSGNVKFSCITAPQRITIHESYVIVTTKSNLDIIIGTEIVSGLKQKYGSVLKALKGLIAIEFEKQTRQPRVSQGKPRTIFVARRVKPLSGETVDGDVTRLYQKYPPICLLLWLMGIEANPVTIRITLPKLLYWYIVENEPIHVAIFENPETGKSHLSLMASTVCGYYYTSEPPSRAFLIHDARQRTSESVVVMYNGIIIDESEKTMQKYPHDWEDFISSCMTGMEQGKWTRSRGYGVTIEKQFTVVIQGNTIEELQSKSIGDYLESEGETSVEDTRQIFIQMLKQYVKRINPAGLASRLTYVTYRSDVPPITQYLLHRCAPTTMIRAIWRLVQNDIDKVCTQIKPLVKQYLEEITGKKFGYESRAFRHVYKVTTLLHVLFRVPVTKELVDIARKFVKMGDISVETVEELLKHHETEMKQKEVETVTSEAEKEESESETDGEEEEVPPPHE